MSPKINPEYENGKLLQVTIIKITESKENKSIQRLDVSSSTGPGGLPRELRGLWVGSLWADGGMMAMKIE